MTTELPIPAGVRGAPIKHKYDANVGLWMYAQKSSVPKKVEPLGGVMAKAQVGLCAALAEWIIIRFDGHLEGELVDEARQRLELAWACTRSPVAVSRFEMTRGDDAVVSPIEITLEQLTTVCRALAGGYRYYRQEIASLMRVCERVIPKRKAFTTWLDAVLARLPPRLPPTLLEEATNQHDATYEPALDRALFVPDAPLPELAIVPRPDNPFVHPRDQVTASDRAELIAFIDRMRAVLGKPDRTVWHRAYARLTGALLRAPACSTPEGRRTTMSLLDGLAQGTRFETQSAASWLSGQLEGVRAALADQPAEWDALVAYLREREPQTAKRL